MDQRINTVQLVKVLLGICPRKETENGRRYEEKRKIFDLSVNQTHEFRI